MTSTNTFWTGADALSFDIRVLGHENYEGIIAIWDRAGLPCKPRGRDSKSEMTRQMDLDPDMFLGCFVDGELVGVIMGSHESRKGWINRLAVVPEHHRKGIAKALIEAIEEKLRGRGLRIIATLIEDHSPESMDLFSEAGYVRHDDIQYYTKRESDDV